MAMSRSINFLVAAVIFSILQPTSHADDNASRNVLKTWLREASTKAAVAPTLTAMPFEYRTTNVKKECEGIFQDSKALAGWWKCFKKSEDYLLTDFQNGGEVEPPSPAGPLPKSLAKLAKRIKTQGTWTQGVFTGDGMTSHFMFLTTETGQIAALLVDVDFF
jgi:hypothetical protein